MYIDEYRSHFGDDAMAERMAYELKPYTVKCRKCGLTAESSEADLRRGSGG